MRKLIFISLIVSLISNEVFSQSNLLNAKNPSEIGVSSSMDKINPTFLEYPEIDEKDILWSKVVYEYIDLNEKLNFPLLFPVNDEQYTDTRKSLWKVIRENIENGNIKEVFDVRNDNFLEKNRIKGLTAYTEDKLINNLKIPSNVNIGVMINVSDLLKNKRSTLINCKKLFRNKNNKLKFVRLACHYEEIFLIKDVISWLKKNNFIVSIYCGSISIEMNSLLLTLQELHLFFWLAVIYC